ncbi:MAG TPA: shikimate kinase [Chitinophagaceae bacterium]|nr:shikimate kinase [Chitinophagaceae bacterium]MCC6634254.1 shikimate kinase [Chitinophagaceae bacterium]HMZ45760.1 shikimate kinase [Chitinophagaceae bacterium]HNF30726.1 shikimate kinase [Chitinophagaceae bacterium]HNL83438.1 shikimate kinase [Chitinophagaceae bacterium]
MKIFLIGMMGSGKTYLSKLIADKIKFTFYDLDQIIEKRAGVEINNIFEEQGELYFRKIETEELGKFENKNNLVLATGGGTPCFNNNMNWMNKHGITIWLNEPLDIICERLMKEKATRPLLKNKKNIEPYLKELLASRIDFYKKATYHFTYSDYNFNNLISTINQLKENE